MKNLFLLCLLSVGLLFLSSCKDRLSSEKYFTSFMFEAQKNDLSSDIIGIIDHTNHLISLTSEDWVNSPESLIATFESVGKVSIDGREQISSVTPNDYSSRTIKYTLTADDNSSVIYDVKLGLRSDKVIRSFYFDSSVNGLTDRINGVIDQEKKTITLSVSGEIDHLDSMIPSFEATGKVTISGVPQISGVTANNFQEIQKYTVTAEDKSKTTYLVAFQTIPEHVFLSFSFEKDKNALNQSLNGIINHETKTITFETKQWVENIQSLIPSFEASGQVTINGNEQESGITANDFRNEIIYRVNGQSGFYNDYKVIFISPQASGLPVLKIDTEGQVPVTTKTIYIDADFKLMDANNEGFSFTGKTTIRGRGNSTWSYPKKPYRIKFEKKTSLLGYGKAKSWVLLANYLDPTLIMNTVAFELGHRFGLPYTNHASHVELYLNGSYKGSYVLTEQIQVNENRVNISETTGFLVELDTYYDEDYKFKTRIIQLPVNVKSPELTSTAGMDFIKTALKDLEDALFDVSKGFPNNNYQDLIDIKTLIDFLLVNEIVQNTELQHPKSMFMYKEADSKIFMGPLWDFDWGYGYSGEFVYFDNYSQSQRMLLMPDYGGSHIGYKFFCRFFDDPLFRTQYKDRWNELYASALVDIDQYVDQLSAMMQKSQVENFKLWNNGLNYKNEISKMKNWLKERIAYLNSEINKF
ncbi:MAG: CotH kinase family protein [Bacteroidales bacterium]|nr:CotH kinase family protein [Bacteroidales bacterium]